MLNTSTVKFMCVCVGDWFECIRMLKSTAQELLFVIKESRNVAHDIWCPNQSRAQKTLSHKKEVLNAPRKPAVSIVHNRPNEDNGCISLQWRRFGGLGVKDTTCKSVRNSNLSY